MEFRMTDLNRPDHPPDTALLSEPTWGADPEASPPAEDLGIAFSIARFDSPDADMFLSRDTDVVGLKITLCSTDWSKRFELKRIPPQKQWNVQIVSLGRLQFFTKDYKLMLANQDFDPDDTACLVRKYVPEYLP